MLEPPIVIVAKNIDQQSQDLGHNVPKDQSDRNQREDRINTLNRIFRRDITISYGSSDCYAVIHDIDVDLLPTQDNCHLVERPSVVDPTQIRSVRTIVIGIVNIHANHIKTNP